MKLSKYNKSKQIKNRKFLFPRDKARTAQNLLYFMRGDFLCLSAEASNTTLYTIFHIEQLLLYPRSRKSNRQ